MTKSRGRPKGAGNANYHDADHRSKLEMARRQLADPGLTDYRASQQVAPQAAGYQGDDRDLGKTARRLYDQYHQTDVKQRYLELARRELIPPPPPPRPLTLAELAEQIERTWRPIVDDVNRTVRMRNALRPKLPR